LKEQLEQKQQEMDDLMHEGDNMRKDLDESQAKMKVL